MSKPKAEHRSSELSVAEETKPIAAKVKDSRKLADALLTCISEESCQKRRETAEALKLRFGFQASSCAAQLQHCESLLLSHLSTGGGDMAAAVSQVRHAHGCGVAACLQLPAL
eukprot:7387559-Prymnesium_polylepis.2